MELCEIDDNYEFTEGDFLKKTALLLSVLIALFLLVSLSSCDKTDPKEALYNELTQNYVTSDGYTVQSYADFEKAYFEARRVYENKDATALEVDRALENLKKARGALTKTADFSQLRLAVQSHESINASSYTEESYRQYLAAYNKALEVYGNDASKQSEINSAVTSLNNAIKNLVRIPDSSSLQQLLQQHISRGEYTTASYSRYEEAYQNALRLVQSESASKNDLLLAENLLKQATSALMLKADTSALSAMYEKVEKDYLQVTDNGRTPESRYSADSFTALMDAVENAEKAITTGDVSEEEVKELTALLKKATEELVDLSALLDRIDLLEEYTKQSSYYTEESYSRFLLAASDGIATATAKGTTAAQVTEAVSKIDSAILKLVRRELAADGQKNKEVGKLKIEVGRSTVSLYEYMNDYAAFFAKVSAENPEFAFYTEGEKGYFVSGKTKLTLADHYFRAEYTGGFPVAEEDIRMVSIGDITFDMTEFEISDEEHFGTPGGYSKRTEMEFGNEVIFAVLTYENEKDGLKVSLEYNTISNYITYMEISSITQSQ